MERKRFAKIRLAPNGSICVASAFGDVTQESLFIRSNKGKML
jgi:hypothetical protein